MQVKKKFIILSAPRSGTQYFQSFLNDHPAFLCYGEAFYLSNDCMELVNHTSRARAREAVELREKEPRRFLKEYVYSNPAAKKEIIGFRLFYSHLKNIWDIDEDVLVDEDNLYVIDLRRQNELRRQVSFAQALLTDEWLTRVKKNAPVPKVRIDPQEFLHEYESFRLLRDRMLSRFSEKRTIQLSYEDLVLDNAKQLERILAFFGLPNVPLRSYIHKQNQDSLQDSITNYHEVAETLSHAGLGWMLKEESTPQDNSLSRSSFYYKSDLANAPRLERKRERRQQNQFRIFCHLGSSDLDILPHFISHYRNLGVSFFHFILHDQGGEYSVSRIKDLDAHFEDASIMIEDRYEESFTEKEKCRRLTELVRRFEGEWVLLADADEFLELPYSNLKKTIRALELCGESSLYATLVQRISESGELSPLGSDEDPEEVYPLAAPLLIEDMGVDMQVLKEKYPLFFVEESSEVHRGHHFAPSLRSTEYLSIHGVMHHFKWRPSVRGTIEQRKSLRDANQGEVWRYGEWLKKNKWCVPTQNAFFASTQNLKQRALLRKMDRKEMTQQTLMHRLVLARTAGVLREALSLDRKISLLESEWRNSPSRYQEPALPAAAGDLTGRSGRILFVAFQLSPIDSTGGIGTWFSAAARLLARAGHRVTIAYVPPKGCENMHYWRLFWRAYGVEFVPIESQDALLDSWGRESALGYELLKWIEGRTFDVIHLHDVIGVGQSLTAAKLYGRLNPNVKIVVTAHGPTSWHFRGNGYPLRESQLRLDHLEKLQLEEADVVVAPTRHLLDWLSESDYSLPKIHYVHPNVLDPQMQIPGRINDEPQQITELVFFGRIEPRKGVDLFCQAIEKLPDRIAESISVTFMGRPESKKRVASLYRRADGWKMSVKILTTLRPNTAGMYLREPGRLAVIPSLQDNLPYTVLECLASGVPFISTRIGGIPEMLREDEIERALVEPDAEAIASKITEAVENGWCPVKPAFEMRESENRWLAWHNRLIKAVDAEKESTISPSGSRFPDISVDVCLSESPYQPWRSWHLQRFLEQSSKTNLPQLAIHLAEESEEFDLLSASKSEGGASGADAVVLKPRSLDDTALGAGANALAQNCSAEAILFVASGVELNPRAVETFWSAMCSHDADAVISGYQLNYYPGSGERDCSDYLTTVFPRGGPDGLAPINNVYGGPCFLVRREYFEKIGAFNEDPTMGTAVIWELLGRIALMGGRVVSVPDVAFNWHVCHEDELHPTASASHACYESLSRFVDPDSRDAYDLARSSVSRFHGSKKISDRIKTSRATEPLSSTGQLVLNLDSAEKLLVMEGLEHVALSLADAGFGEGVQILSSGCDPMVLLPKYDFIGPTGLREHLVEIHMTSSHPSTAQIYWAPSWQLFSEAQTKKHPVRKGENILRFRLPPILPRGELRFDPLACHGRCIVHGVRVWIDKEATPISETETAQTVPDASAADIPPSLTFRVKRKIVHLTRRTVNKVFQP